MADKSNSLNDTGTQTLIPIKEVDLGDGTFAQAVALYVYTGTGWVQEPTPLDVTYLASAGRTITQTQADQNNNGWRGIIVVLDMTVVGTGSVTLTIQGKDAASGKYYTLLVGAAVVINSTNIYYLFPGGPVAANVSANMELPKVFRILVTANNANSATYSVGYSLLI